MKIEKINDNQIKCTLTRSDLASHQLKMSELVYDSEKSKQFFQDMMEQASTEVGFETGDLSVVVEAIPVSMDCIILMITKVEDPDAADQQSFGRFSRLNDIFPDAGSEAEDLITDIPEDEFVVTPPSAAAKEPQRLERMYSFDKLETVIKFAHQAGRYFHGESSLYKSPENGRYYLILKNSGDVKEFGLVCNSAFEYGSKEPYGFARSAFIDEHFELIIRDNALQSLVYV